MNALLIVFIPSIFCNAIRVPLFRRESLFILHNANRHIIFCAMLKQFTIKFPFQFPQYLTFSIYLFVNSERFDSILLQKNLGINFAEF